MSTADDRRAEELAGSLLPSPRDPGDPTRSRREPPVMDRPTRMQLVASPHVHDPDGTCVRNRFAEACDARFVPDFPAAEPRESCEST